MPATTPPLRSEFETHDHWSRDVRRVETAPLREDGPRPRSEAEEPTPRSPFSTKGKVPVATTIVLFAVVGALIAFIAIAGA
jgi:hypothetical protein